MHRCLFCDGAFDKTLLEFNGTLLKCNFGRIEGSTEKEKQIMLKSDCISGHNDTQHNDTQHIGIISNFQLNATYRNDAQLNTAIMLSVEFILFIVMLNVIMTSVLCVMLNVIILRVVAPFNGLHTTI